MSSRTGASEYGRLLRPMEDSPMPKTATALATLLLSAALALATSSPVLARDDSEQMLTIDHFVPHVSTAPAIAGQSVQLYAREKVLAGAVLHNQIGTGKVVLPTVADGRSLQREPETAGAPHPGSSA